MNTSSLPLWYLWLRQKGFYSLPHSIYLKMLIPELQKQLGKKMSNLDKSIVISGSPRSGTTWLGEVMSAIPRAFNIHEPLAPGRLKMISELQFSERQHIPEDEDWPEAYQFFRQLLSGQILAPALLINDENLPAMRKAEWLIFKFVKANQLLPWLTRNFPQLKCIYIVRHPGSVVDSIQKHPSFDFRKSIKFPRSFTVREQPYGEFYRKITDTIFPLQNSIQLSTLMWALDCYPLFHAENNKSWVTISYEELLLRPQETINTLCKRLQLDTETEKEILSRVNKPSISTQKGNPLLLPQEQLSKWQTQISNNEKDDIQKVLDFFGITFYQMDQDEPDYDAIRGQTKTHLFND